MKYGNRMPDGIRDFQDQIGRLLEEATGRTPERFLGDSGWRPLVNIYRGDDSIVVVAELPGYETGMVGVEISEDLLTISGRDPGPAGTEGAHCFRMERNCGSFRRVFPMPVGIDARRTSAVLRNGILRIELPLLADSGRRRIEISGEDERR